MDWKLIAEVLLVLVYSLRIYGMHKLYLKKIFKFRITNVQAYISHLLFISALQYYLRIPRMRKHICLCVYRMRKLNNFYLLNIVCALQKCAGYTKTRLIPAVSFSQAYLHYSFFLQVPYKNLSFPKSFAKYLYYSFFYAVSFLSCLFIP